MFPWEMHQREKPCSPRVDLLLLIQEALRTLGGQRWPFLRPECPPTPGSAGPGYKSLPGPRSSPIPLPPSCPDIDLGSWPWPRNSIWAADSVAPRGSAVVGDQSLALFCPLLTSQLSIQPSPAPGLTGFPESSSKMMSEFPTLMEINFLQMMPEL